MPSQENSFGKKLIRGIRNTAIGVGGAALMVHAVSQENPTTLKERSVPKKEIDSIYNQFDAESREELTKLQKEYVIGYLEKYPGADARLLNARFRNMVAEYGAGLKLRVGDHEHENAKEKAFNFFMRDIQHRPPELQAHYLGDEISFQPEEVVTGPGNFGERYLELNVFLSELSHHIDQDEKIGRLAHYAEGLVHEGLSQKGVYFDDESVEFQAHMITEPALRSYLFAPPAAFKKTTFEHMREHFVSLHHELFSKGAQHPLSKEQRALALYCYGHYAPEHAGHMHEYRKNFLAALNSIGSFPSLSGLSEHQKAEFFDRVLPTVVSILATGGSESQVQSFLNETVRMQAYL